MSVSVVLPWCLLLVLVLYVIIGNIRSSSRAAWWLLPVRIQMRPSLNAIGNVTKEHFIKKNCQFDCYHPIYLSKSTAKYFDVKIHPLLCLAFMSRELPGCVVCVLKKKGRLYLKLSQSSTKVSKKNAVPWHPRLVAADSHMSVLVPLLEINSKPSLLFTMRSIHLNHHRGEICFPGGKMEKDEGVEEAALREMQEEIGIDPKSVDVWGRLKPVLTRNLKETVVPVVGCVDKDVLKPELVNKHEMQTLFSASLEELSRTARYTHFSTKMVDFVLPVFFTKDFDVHWHNKEEFLPNEFRIWGLSAIMLHQLLLVMAPEEYRNNLKLVFY